MAAGVFSISRAIARVVSRQREIQAAYLFGSTANGRVRPDSDVDVAVLLARPVATKRSLDYVLSELRRPAHG